MKKLFADFLAILLLALAFLSAAEAIAGTYTTNFSLTENPISEASKWINGQTVGLDWTNISTTPGGAHGNSSVSNPPYKDPTALLVGNWGADQTVQGTVYSVNQTESYYQEVELRLRSSLSAHLCRGYEVLFRCLKTGAAYASIVRWNGALGNFTELIHQNGAAYGVANGDVVKATIIGDMITAYINNVQVLQVTDNTYSSGNPGMGFNYGVGSTFADFGFSAFTASDEADELPPSPPKNLHTLP